MNISYERLAYASMLKKRHCPPLSILQAGGELIKRHLNGCKDCRDLLADAPKYQELAKMFESKMHTKLLPFATQASADPTIGSISGEIRNVNPLANQDLWDEDGIYHNPPMVLILTEPDDMGCVLVAQIHDEFDLAIDGEDIPLNNAKEEFVEAWNSYSLPITGLSQICSGKVEPAIVKQVLEASQKEYQDLDENSPLYFFRCAEIDAGSFFSLPLTINAVRKWEAKAQKPTIMQFREATKIEQSITKWQTSYQDLALAAASDSPYSQEAGEHHTLPVILKTTHTETDIKATVIIEPKNSCDIHCTIPTEYLSAKLSYYVLYDGKEANRIEIEWEDYSQGKLQILANFAEDLTDMQKLHTVILISEE